MKYRAIYTYPWDLIDAGIDAAVGEFRSMGLSTVSVAASYHAGKFLRPHGRSGKVYFPQDGTVYFRPELSRYGSIKPLPSHLATDRDVVAELCARSDIATNAWMVLLHNTRLGLENPGSVVRNAFGDPYFYTLCPCAPEVRAFATELVLDLTDRYGVAGVTLEVPGFMPYEHGYHHEFGLVRRNRWLDDRLGICFCRHCQRSAAAAGIDARGLASRIADDVTRYLDDDVELPEDMAAEFWSADILNDEELRSFLAWRTTVVTSLVSEIRSRVRNDVVISVCPTVDRPIARSWYEGSDLKALARAGVVVEACFYEPSLTRIKADLFDVKRRIAGAGELRAVLRPAYPDIETKDEFLATFDALVSGGVSGAAFYNWGHLKRSNIAWIGEAMARLEAAGNSFSPTRNGNERIFPRSSNEVDSDRAS